MAQRVLRQSPPEASGVPSRVVRLAQIEVAGLFRRFDHRIPMNLDERITIIHGPNGVGKTTVLRLLSYMFSQRFDRLRRLPFQSMTLTFEDRAILEVRRRERQTEQKLPLAAELFFTIRQGTRGRIASEWER